MNSKGDNLRRTAMKGKLENRNAVITGGGSVIGRTIGAAFAREGANLFLCARRMGPLDETAAELQQRFGTKVVTSSADVTVVKSVQKMARHALEEFENIDILVNNAGAYKASRFIDYAVEDIDRIIKTNLYGTIYVTQAFLPQMMSHKKGKIINVASTAGKWGSRNQSAYNASKHAIVGLTRCIALEVGAYDIQVNAICPGLVETEMLGHFLEEHAKILGCTAEEFRKQVTMMIPTHKFVQPEDIAAFAVYLASNESDSMTAQSVSICGGHIMV